MQRQEAENNVDIDMVNPSYVLVTGGAGYIGTHIIVELLQRGYHVVAIDNFANITRASGGSNSAAVVKTSSSSPSTALPESLKRVISICQVPSTQLKFFELDLMNYEALCSHVFKEHNIACVIHLAALKAVGESVSRPLDYYGINIGIMVNLLRAMREFNVKKLIHSSSSTVYGPAQTLPIDETHPTGRGLTNPYAKSKYVCEEVIKDYCFTDDKFRAIILRYFNPVGAHASGLIGEDPPRTPRNLMPYLAQVSVGRLEKLKIFGNDWDTKDGTCVRDYTHVVDVARGHVTCIDLLNARASSENANFAAQANWHGYKLYNLGNGSGKSVLDVIKAFEKACGKPIPHEFVPRRTGDLCTVFCTTKKAETELDWTAEYDLNAMCRDFWNWQNSNTHGYYGSHSKS